MTNTSTTSKSSACHACAFSCSASKGSYDGNASASHTQGGGVRRRVVVTGAGVVCPLGVGVHYVWPKILNGECGLTNIQGEGYDKIPCQVAGHVPRGDGEGQFNFKAHVTPAERNSVNDGIAFALAATNEALEQADWKPSVDESRVRTGVAVGMGMAGLQDIVDTALTLHQKGYRRVSAYFVPRILPNMAAGHISMRYQFKGPNHAVSTACTTGAHAIGDASRFISHGDADVMVAGGAEACICPIALAGFARARALSTNFNDTPQKASRPFDKTRDGFVMAEGAAIVILEEYEHAVSRGATILAEILGYGLAGDASHITAPSEDGQGAEHCMKNALRDAQVDPSEVGYINAHATSTPLGDAIENQAIKRLFKSIQSQLAVSSTKGATGHLLGGAGALEAVFTIMACHTGKMPPTINLTEKTEEFDMNYVLNLAQDWNISNQSRRIALTNSFGFGGTNASLCIGSV
ncbi:3-oxoacyl-[acyl-carrier-protein] synthase, mitochondrial-like [Amphiura filiformis]|uniref:3-oxoacyl-[acyl-carrier-protein] synthase, mitochondrial-like n=1 Tax=Amphiura filiformis TaxID=82378 RepID=UPI003B2266F4